MATSTRVKVACVTCYFDPDYVRSRTIRAGLADNPAVELIVIKNSSKGAARYLQVIRQMLRVKRENKPDVWLLNFRGYELLPFLQLIAGRTPIIYDEFVNPVLVTNEHRQQKTGLIKALMGIWKILGWFYYLLLRRCTVILADTETHGQYAAKLAGVNSEKYAALPVGTDENVFNVQALPKPPTDKFQVFFYSTGVQPLHGTEYVLDAAVRLKDVQDIEFVISGSRGNLKAKVDAARAEGARITHLDWIQFAELPNYIKTSNLCLGGPFGDTPQARMVITTKAYQFLACGVPAILGESPVMTMFKDKVNALVVPQANAVALAKAIRWAKANPDKLAKIGQAGRKTFEAEFSQAHITEELAKVIRRASGQPSA